MEKRVAEEKEGDEDHWVHELKGEKAIVRRGGGGDWLLHQTRANLGETDPARAARGLGGSDKTLKPWELNDWFWLLLVWNFSTIVLLLGPATARHFSFLSLFLLLLSFYTLDFVEFCRWIVNPVRFVEGLDTWRSMLFNCVSKLLTLIDKKKTAVDVDLVEFTNSASDFIFAKPQSHYCTFFFK